MSFNELMHPRNLYRIKPDYLKLGEKYPSFKEILVYYKNGKARINFNDPRSLRLLTTTLLHHDFDLKVNLPLDRLIPAVPQRLNYVLWVEDLLGLLDLAPSEAIIGLDIGTGPCCIFPLLGCSLNKSWTFIATETDDVSHQYAVNNVNDNQLSHRIKVIKVNSDMFLLKLPGITQLEAHFLMCNPPFFKDRFHNDVSECQDNDEQEQWTKYRPKKPSPSNLSSDIESVTQGGEVTFVLKIIEESLILKKSVKIYSVMLGHKKSALVLSEHLKNLIEVKDVMVNQFYQGRTMRWGLAWTFLENLNLAESIGVNHTKRPTKKKSPPLIYSIPKDLKNIHYSLQSIYRWIRHLLRDELDITTVNIVRESSHSVEMIIRSQRDTWSHQRRRRRMMSKQQKEPHQMANGCGDELSESTKTEEMELEGGDDVHQKLPENDEIEVEEIHSPGKRKLGEDDEMEYNAEDDEVKKVRDERKVTTFVKEEEFYLLYCCCTLKKVDNDVIVLEMKSKDKAKSKEATHQLFQYFKNNFN